MHLDLAHPGSGLTIFYLANSELPTWMILLLAHERPQLVDAELVNANLGVFRLIIR